MACSANVSLLKEFKLNLLLSNVANVENLRLGKYIKMSSLFNRWSLLMLIIFFGSCFEAPNYSVIPVIELKSVSFIDVADPYNVDSLQVVIGFKDGDGDLGLNANETDAPYNEKTYLYTNTGTLVTYKTKRTNPNYAYLPSFVSPYNCTNWEVRKKDQQIDTVYFESNPNQYNIFVQFYLKNQDGSYSEFDWQKEFASYPSCGETFNGRFPVLSKDLSLKKPLEGSIKYSMKSVGFLVLFNIKTLKLRITIQDRALNKSNTIDTGDFTLQQIMSGG